MRTRRFRSVRRVLEEPVNASLVQEHRPDNAMSGVRLELTDTSRVERVIRAKPRNDSTFRCGSSPTSTVAPAWILVAGLSAGTPQVRERGWIRADITEGAAWTVERQSDLRQEGAGKGGRHLDPYRRGGQWRRLHDRVAVRRWLPMSPNVPE
jgi:hypothetical protein